MPRETDLLRSAIVAVRPGSGVGVGFIAFAVPILDAVEILGIEPEEDPLL